VNKISNDYVGYGRNFGAYGTAKNMKKCNTTQNNTKRILKVTKTFMYFVVSAPKINKK